MSEDVYFFFYAVRPGNWNQAWVGRFLVEHNDKQNDLDEIVLKRYTYSETISLSIRMKAHVVLHFTLIINKELNIIIQ